MEAIKYLGERIKAERIAQGYSVKTAAEASGIARDTWRKIEAGGSVQDTKRHRAMEFLGISDRNTEWGTVGDLEEHAASFSGGVDLNVMFSQAVRFTATVGVLVPQVRDEAERVSVALSDLFAHGLELWDKKPLDERYDLLGDDEPVVPNLGGGDGNVDADDHAGDPAPTQVGREQYELAADEQEIDPLDEAEETERST